eukprot:16461-Rhodomonas_salina.1
MSCYCLGRVLERLRTRPMETARRDGGCMESRARGPRVWSEPLTMARECDNQTVLQFMCWLACIPGVTPQWGPDARRRGDSFP